MDRRSRIDIAVSITYDNSFIIIIEIIYFLENLNQIREIFTKIFINVTQSHKGLCFFIACSFLFFCEFIVPLIITKAELCRRRLGFAMADLTAVIQKLLDKSFIGCFFWDVFHNGISLNCFMINVLEGDKTNVYYLHSIYHTKR